MAELLGLYLVEHQKKLKDIFKIGNYFHLNLNSKMIQKYHQLKQKF